MDKHRRTKDDKNKSVKGVTSCSKLRIGNNYKCFDEAAFMEEKTNTANNINAIRHKMHLAQQHDHHQKLIHEYNKLNADLMVPGKFNFIFKTSTTMMELKKLYNWIDTNSRVCKLYGNKECIDVRKNGEAWLEWSFPVIIHFGTGENFQMHDDSDWTIKMVHCKIFFCKIMYWYDMPENTSWGNYEITLTNDSRGGLRVNHYDFERIGHDKLNFSSSMVITNKK